MKKVEINCDICNKAFKENEYVYCQWGHRYCLECFKGVVKAKGKINELQKRIDKAIEYIEKEWYWDGTGIDYVLEILEGKSE